MHLEILVEDQSGKKALDILVSKIIKEPHTFRVLSYKGIGRVPKDLSSRSERSKRMLLDQLPRILKGYGKTFANYSADSPAAVILVCDLDDKCLKHFRQELYGILYACSPQPITRFCIAVEEGEAWFLGDISAVKRAFPKAKETVLEKYENDSICGTWETLADAVFPGGASALFKKGWQGIGAEKAMWSETIAPHMDVRKNASPSFNYFCAKVLELAQSTP